MLDEFQAFAATFTRFDDFEAALGAAVSRWARCGRCATWAPPNGPAIVRRSSTWATARADRCVFRVRRSASRTPRPARTDGPRGRASTTRGVARGARPRRRRGRSVRAGRSARRKASQLMDLHRRRTADSRFGQRRSGQGRPMDTEPLSRRRALTMLSGAGLAALVGCASNSKTSAASASTSTVGSSPASSSAAASTVATGVIPEETAGPFPATGRTVRTCSRRTASCVATSRAASAR